MPKKTRKPKGEEYSVDTNIMLEDGSVLPWSRAKYLLFKENGEYRSECISNEFLMSLEDRRQYEKKMMERVGEQMSLRYSRGEFYKKEEVS